MNILVTAALAFFFAVGLGLAAAGGIRAAWRGLGRRRGVSAALAAFAVVATICAQKPGPSGPTITIDALLRDAGCYATNDVFHAAVSNAPAYAAIDFSACPVLVYARERGQTNAADWAELTPRRTFSELPADYAIANATNYNYMVYLDYVPPSPVHTNGVFELHGFVVPDDEPGNLEQLSAGFINSRAIPPPYDAEVEYLENTSGNYAISGSGNAGNKGSYINTGILPKGNGVVEIGFYLPTSMPSQAYQSMFGGYAANTRNFGVVFTGNTTYFLCGNQKSVSQSIVGGVRYDAVFNASEKSLTINGVTKTFSVSGFSGSSNAQIYLFSNSATGNTASYVTTYTLKGRIYYFRYYEGTTLVFDAIPVRKRSVGYLYDRVSGQLFGNVGIGAFGVGPDK